MPNSWQSNESHKTRVKIPLEWIALSGKQLEQKIQAAIPLKRRGYKSSPLRRIYIPKKNGKLRPLGIPAMIDRSQQALHLLL